MDLNRGAIDEMARILNALSTVNESAPADIVDETGFSDPYDTDDTPAFEHTGEIDPFAYEDDRSAPIRSTVVTSSASVDAMKAILESFHSAQSDAPALAAVASPEVREALTTTPTPRGARIGSWEIVKEGAATPSYHVVNSSTGAPIAKGLQLYDAALGLVRCLNEGVSITDVRVRDLLDQEASYVRNASDAQVYRERAKRLREKADDQRAAVAEDRLDEAERQAEMAVERILKLAGLR